MALGTAQTSTASGSTALPAGRKRALLLGCLVVAMGVFYSKAPPVRDRLFARAVGLLGRGGGPSSAALAAATAARARAAAAREAPGDGAADGPASARSWSDAGASSAAVSAAAAGGGAAGAPPRARLRGPMTYEDEDVCADVYPACAEWKRNPALRDVVLALVGNELYQQLPTIGYGGIETSVDNVANALRLMRMPFFAVVPGRREWIDMPFRVLETEIAPNGVYNKANEFVAQARAIIGQEVHAAWTIAENAGGAGSPAGKAAAVAALTDRTRKPVAAPGSRDPAPREEGDPGPPPLPASPRLAIWGQSLWSQNFADLSAVTVVSHHDGGGPLKGWNKHMPNVRHRFLSQDQMQQWVPASDGNAEENEWGWEDRERRRKEGRGSRKEGEGAVARVVPHGLPRDAYKLCEDQGYFLWVAALDWGWKEKGIDIFIMMARLRPQYRFVAYGSARNPMARGYISELYEIAKEQPNFEFRGELRRGAQHTAAFCGATAFVMPTHYTIGESFGMTVIESLSKGVPVIASTNGAVPEILDVRGKGGSRAGRSRYGVTCEGEDWDCYAEAADALWGRTPERSKEIQAYAWNKYDSLYIVDMMIDFTLQGLLPSYNSTSALPAGGAGRESADADEARSGEGAEAGDAEAGGAAAGGDAQES